MTFKISTSECLLWVHRSSRGRGDRTCIEKLMNYGPSKPRHVNRYRFNKNCSPRPSRTLDLFFPSRRSNQNKTNDPSNSSKSFSRNAKKIRTMDKTDPRQIKRPINGNHSSRFILKEWETTSNGLIDRARLSSRGAPPKPGPAKLGPHLLLPLRHLRRRRLHRLL